MARKLIKLVSIGHSTPIKVYEFADQTKSASERMALKIYREGNGEITSFEAAARGYRETGLDNPPNILVDSLAHWLRNHA
jgi:hypothetical protein